MKRVTKAFTVMTTSAVVLAILIISMLATTVFGQSVSCPNKCENSTAYYKGSWNEKLKSCVYAYQEVCEYGCSKGNIGEFQYDLCQEYPDTLPVDEVEARNVIFEISKSIIEDRESDVLVDVRGTEYVIDDDNGKAFLQLLDDQRQAISNASCFVSIFYPNSTKHINQTLMDYVDEGLFYLDIQIQNVEGVYMVSAFCVIPTIQNATAQDDFESGDFDGGLGWLSNWSTSGTVEISDGEEPFGVWHLRGRALFDVNRSFSNSGCTHGFATFNAKAQSLEAGEMCNYSYYNGTDWHLLYSITRDLDNYNVYRYYSYEVCSTYGASNNSAFGVFSYANTPDDKCFLDNVMITRTDEYNETDFQFVRGSGELHVTDLPFETYLKFATLPEPILVSNHNYCVDNSTLIRTLTWEVCVGNKCKNVQRNETVVCSYGCYGNLTFGQCNPEPFDKTLFLILVFLAVVVVVILLALAYDRFTK